MNQPGFFELMSFGPDGWAPALLRAALTTFCVAASGFVLGSIIGVFLTWAKLSGSRAVRVIADIYTTVMRGIPDLLVIYLFYFGSSVTLTRIAGFFGHDGYIDVPAFVAGVTALGIVSAAQHAEVFRGAFNTVNRGELEAAMAIGMNRGTMLRRITFPLVARHALPGMGNVWQITLKESALISVTGVVELVRQAQIGAGSMRQPFYFFLAAAILFLVITSLSSVVLNYGERYFNRGVRRG